MNPKLPQELPYQEQVQFALEPMPAFRDSDEPCQENDAVQIFMDADGKLIAVALGFRNFAFYIGMVMSFGAPYGFGKVMHVVNGTAFVYNSVYPSQDEPETGVMSQNGNETGTNYEN